MGQLAPPSGSNAWIAAVGLVWAIHSLFREFPTPTVGRPKPMVRLPGLHYFLSLYFFPYSLFACRLLRFLCRLSFFLFQNANVLQFLQPF